MKEIKGMERKVKRHPSLDMDINEAFNWYEEKKAGLGYEFFIEFENTIERICYNPKMFHIKQNDYREAYLKRFPYVLFFKIINEEEVFIYSITHDKRLPEVRYKRI